MEKGIFKQNIFLNIFSETTYTAILKTVILFIKFMYIAHKSRETSLEFTSVLERRWGTLLGYICFWYFVSF
jgi:hypothetical protein